VETTRVVNVGTPILAILADLEAHFPTLAKELGGKSTAAGVA
jgi:hypothetical protein